MTIDKQAINNEIGDPMRVDVIQELVLGCVKMEYSEP